MNKKIVSIAAFVGIAALIIAPLCLLYLDREMLFPYITGKNFFWRFFVELAVVGWIVSALFSRRYRFSIKNPLFIALSVFMGVILISNILGHDPYQSFWSNAERMDGYISLLHLYGYFIALIGFIREKKHAHWMLLYLMGIGVLLSVMGWGQEKERIDSVLGNPIYLGSLTLFGVFLSGYFMVIKEKLWGFPQTFRIVFYGLFALLFLYTLFRTGTRGALLGLIAGGFITALLFAVARSGHVEKWWRYLGAAGVSIVILFGGLFFGAREQLAEIPAIADNYLLGRVVETTSDETTTRTRIANWEMAIAGFKEKPVFGWGQENYTPVFSKYYDLQDLWFAEQWYDRVHNTFLDWLVFGGIVGFVAYISLFAVLIYCIWRYAQVPYMQKSVLTGLVVAYLFQNIVAFDSLVSGVFLYSVFAFVFIIGRGEEESDELDEAYHVAKYIALVVLAILTVWWMNVSIIEPRQASKSFITYLQTVGGRERTPENVEATLPVFQQVFERDTFISRELTGIMIQRSHTYRVNGMKKSVHDQYVNTIVQESEKIYERYNSPTKSLLSTGLFLMDLGELEAAEPYLVTANRQSPDKAQIAWMLGILYERQERFDEARDLLEHIKNTAPEFEQAQIVYDEFVEKYGEE